MLSDSSFDGKIVGLGACLASDVNDGNYGAGKWKWTKFVIGGGGDDDEIVVDSVDPSSKYQDEGKVKLTVEGENLDKVKSVFFFNSENQTILKNESKIKNQSKDKFEIEVNVSKTHDGADSAIGKYIVMVLSLIHI